MGDFYYLTTHHGDSNVQVRSYKDNSIVKTYPIDDTWVGGITLVGITDSLLVMMNGSNMDKKIVYSFDCTNKDSLKRCYEFDSDGIAIDTPNRYSLGNRMVVAHERHPNIRYVAWKFTETGYERIGEWTLPMRWDLTEIIKLSDHQLLSIPVRRISISKPTATYLTTLMESDGTGTVESFTSSVIEPQELDKMGLGVLNDIIDKQDSHAFTSVKSYPNHRLLLTYNWSNYSLYQRSHTSNSMVPIQKGKGLSSGSASSIINGALMTVIREESFSAVSIPDFRHLSHVDAFSQFFAYPSKRKIEQMYLPVLLPVLKGCKDLAILAASYLEWDNDIVN